MDIEDWRDEIDALDEQLVDLLNKRSKCCIEIGRIKRQRGLAVYSPAREAQVLDHVASQNGGPLESDAVRRLFERIIDESRRLERVTIDREAGNTGLEAQAIPGEQPATRRKSVKRIAGRKANKAE